MNQPTPATPDDSAIRRAWQREKAARKLAEQLLEDKSRELYIANRDLQSRADALQQTLNELRDTQEQLLQSEKLASLGQLAAGVAHEINNPMGFITSNLGSLRDYLHGYRDTLRAARAACAAVQNGNLAQAGELAEQTEASYAEHDLDFAEEDIDELLDDSLKGAQRVRDIVQGLRNFARVDSRELESFDLNDCLRDALKLARVELDQRADVHSHFAELPALQGNAGQLTQVLVNLLVNAAQAIDGHGRVEVSSRLVGDTAQVDIRDNGCGISAEDRDKLFTPFFTTKPVGSGTGLGLSISYGIVQKHGGHIEVESEPGSGSRFTVILPLANTNPD
jgi:signal transduction histidine kinase